MYNRVMGHFTCLSLAYKHGSYVHRICYVSVIMGHFTCLSLAYVDVYTSRVCRYIQITCLSLAHADISSICRCIHTYRGESRDTHRGESRVILRAVQDVVSCYEKRSNISYVYICTGYIIFAASLLYTEENHGSYISYLLHLYISYLLHL